MSTPLTLGAVAYDPKVVTIWDGFQRWFHERDLPFDYVLYTSYERQVQGLLRGEHHVAWNSPLAWLQAERAAAAQGRRAHAVAMRDTDRDLTSVLVVRADSDVTTPAALEGRAVGFGASDSPQATLIPRARLRVPVRERLFDVLVGKHGDHIGGERDAARALLRGEVDAAWMLDANHLGFSRDGTLPPGSTRVVDTTEPFDHCNFTVLDDAPAGLVGRFVALLLAQRYDDPSVRPLMDLEGLRAWMPGRTTGYRALADAISLDPETLAFGVPGRAP
ncbi:MAG: PhnD/SsuA/transferrin family substrate-binding protein [Polyangiales bacterium]